MIKVEKECYVLTCWIPKEYFIIDRESATYKTTECFETYEEASKARDKYYDRVIPCFSNFYESREFKDKSKWKIVKKTITLKA